MILISSLLGGVLTLDVLVAFQFMVSRPLVAAVLTGLALGEPGVGLALGCLMELIWLGALPVGRVVPPDFTLGAVFGCAAAIMMHTVDPALHWEACIVWALLWSLPFAWLAGYADQWQRHRHFSIAVWAEKSVALGNESALGVAMLASALMAFFRGALLCGLALALAIKPMTLVLARVAEPTREALDWMYWLGLLLGFVVALDHFWERRWLGASGLSFVVSAVCLYGLGVGTSTVLASAAAVALAAATILERRSRA